MFKEEEVVTDGTVLEEHEIITSDCVVQEEVEMEVEKPTVVVTSAATATTKPRSGRASAKASQGRPGVIVAKIKWHNAAN